jgi:hypothetical protein
MPNNSKPKTSKRVRQWTLLIISNRGKSITIKWFKTLAITTASILVIAIASSAWFGFLFKNSVESKKILLVDLKNLKHKITSLEHEKDILMARLILTESRVEESMPKTDEPIPLEKTAAKDTNIDKKSVPPEIPINISADDLIVFHQPDLNTLRVQYVLRNTGSKANAVTGRSVVILKNKEEDDPKNWLILPHVPLISGKPSGKNGRNFSISNLKTMKFRANDQPGPSQFNIATVYIYSTKGELLIEKEFPIGIKFQTLPAPQKNNSKPLPDTKKIPNVSPPKKEKPEASPVTEKKPGVTPHEEIKKPDTSLKEVEKQITQPSDESVGTEPSSKESDKTFPDQIESDEQTPTLKDTD